MDSPTFDSIHVDDLHFADDAEAMNGKPFTKEELRQLYIAYKDAQAYELGVKLQEQGEKNIKIASTISH